jgi:hypothetical protein
MSDASRFARGQRSMYRCSEGVPDDERTVLAYCKDGEYRTVRYCADEKMWRLRDSIWQAYGNEEPVYWWEVPEVTHD